MRRHLWRAPADDGGILVDPPPAEIDAAVQRNRRQFEESKATFAGISLPELRAALHQEISANAASLYAPLMPQTPPAASAPWIVSGHQPELFHPGVWLKSFAASAIARRLGGEALHLIVDADTVKTESIRLPAVDDDPQKVKIASVPFDRASGEPPIERWRCRDESLFGSVPAETGKTTCAWGFEPILAKFWKEAQAFRAAAPAGANIGLRFAFARRRFESEWGCRACDILQSGLCRSRVFAAFLTEILLRPGEFHRHYNDRVRDYRRTHKLHSVQHPVPDLSESGDWFELPFWVLDPQSTRRMRLFSRRRDSRVQLRAGEAGETVELASTADATAEFLAGGAWQVRTRALMTTLFARLFVADLFVHGIGGAKYDEVSDHLIRDFFGLPAPEYAVVTGTLHVPLPAFPAIRANHDQLWRWLRDLDWNPERFVDAPDAATAELVAEKQKLRSVHPFDSSRRKERFRELQRLTFALRPAVASKRAKIERMLHDCDDQIAANAILQRRDYAFVLFPESKLRPYCSRLDGPAFFGGS